MCNLLSRAISSAGAGYQKKGWWHQYKISKTENKFCSLVFSADESDSGVGLCGWLLTAISWALVMVTLPFSLCVCFKVSPINIVVKVQVLCKVFDIRRIFLIQLSRLGWEKEGSICLVGRSKYSDDALLVIPWIGAKLYSIWDRRCSPLRALCGGKFACVSSVSRGGAIWLDDPNTL